MTLLFLDVETSGFLKPGLPPASPEQPWCVSVAAELCDDFGRQIAALSTGIRAAGRAVTNGAAKVHGITTAAANRSGINELAALGAVCGKESFLSQARVLIGHNITFDIEVIGCVLARQNRDVSALKRAGLQIADTMHAAMPFCRLPSDHADGGYKWPSLDEACEILLGEPRRAGIHSARDDLQRTKRLFFWLRDHRAFDLTEAA